MASGEYTADVVTRHSSLYTFQSLCMSRAFVNEDAGSGGSGRRWLLPPRDDPSFDEAAARALLEAAREGDTESAEIATGYYWGEQLLRPHVARLLERARADGDERLTQLAERFLR